MAKDNETNVKVGADVAGLTEGLKAAGKMMSEFSKQIKNDMAGWKSMVDGMTDLKSALSMATSAFSGIGSAIKKTVTEAANWTSQAKSTANSLRMTTQEASILNVALENVGVTTDEYARATTALTQQISAGSDAFEKFGIKTKDANGELRPANDVMRDAISKLNSLKEGTERNIAGVALFGRSWGETSKVLKVSEEAMAKAKETAEKYNLVVGPEAVASQERYQTAMDETKTIVKALSISIGNEFMEAFTDFAKGMNEGGGIVQAFTNIVKGLLTAWDALVFVIQAAVNAIVALVMTLYEAIKGPITAICQVLTGDFKGAWATIKETGQNIAIEWKAAFDEIGDHYEEMIAKFNKKWGDKPAGTGDSKGNTPEVHPTPEEIEEAKKRRLQQWAFDLKQLQAQKAREAEANGQFYEMSLAEEKKFWQNKLKIADLSKEQHEALQSKLLDIEKNMRREKLTAKLAELSAEQSEDAKNLELKKATILKEIALYKDGTKEQIAAKLKLRDVEREIADMQLRIAASARDAEKALALAAISEERNIQAHRLAMGEMTNAQRLAAERKLIEDEYTLRMDAIQTELQARAMAYEERIKLDNEYTALKAEFDRKIAENERQIQLEQKSYWNDLSNTIQGSMQDAFIGLVNGTKSWGDATRDILNNILQSFIRMTAQQLVQHMTIEKMKTLFTAKSTTERTAIETASSTKSMALEIATATKKMIAHAWAASAAAFQAMAGVPYVGPALAVGAGAAALGAVLAMVGKLNSAEGGWGQVPSDQLAMIHKNEMILPEKYASPMRDMLEEGEMPGGGAVNISINAVDAASIEKLFMSNGPALARAIKAQARNFAFT
jgi:hypothetical protein